MKHLSQILNDIITQTPLAFSLLHTPEELLAHKPYFELLYSQTISFGVSHSRIASTYAFTDSYLSTPDEHFYSLFDILASRDTIAQQSTTQILDELMTTYGAYAYFIFKRKLGGTIGVKTLNKYFTSRSLAPIVPQLTVMRYTDLALDRVYNNTEYTIFTKYDGAFVMITPTGIFTRGLHKLPHINTPYLAKAVDLAIQTQTVIFAEAIINQGKLGERYALSGLLTQLRTGTVLTWPDSIELKCFDSLNYHDWTSQTSSTEFSQRLSTTELFCATLNSDKVTVAAHKTLFPRGASLIPQSKIVQQFTSTVVNHGYEGSVLVPNSSTYTFKRNIRCMRYKERLTVDLRVVNYTRGKAGSKFEDKIGALICTGTINKTPLRILIAAGLTDELRDIDTFSTNFYNRIIEVAYNELKGDQLILARYIATRDEQDEPNEHN